MLAARPWLLVHAHGLAMMSWSQAHGAHGAPFYLRLVAFDGVNLALFACLAASAVLLRSRRSPVDGS